MGAWIETSEQRLLSPKTAVAPLVGAWIETTKVLLKTLMRLVAPLVGAWIETVVKANESNADAKSHPSWVRGLKLEHDVRSLNYNQSHPSWVRGLKLKSYENYQI